MHVPAAHESQGREEMTAKLAIGDPGLVLSVWLKRKSVDKNWSGADELDIEGAGVFELEIVFEGELMEAESEEGGGFELAKAPFIRVGNKGYGIGFDDQKPLWSSRFDLGLLVAD